MSSTSRKIVTDVEYLPFWRLTLIAFHGGATPKAARIVGVLPKILELAGTSADVRYPLELIEHE